jgi:hypothetical protein
MTLESVQNGDSVLIGDRETVVSPVESKKRRTYDGMEGWLVPSALVAFLYAGSPGVLGSPGYTEICR